VRLVRAIAPHRHQQHHSLGRRQRRHRRHLRCLPTVLHCQRACAVRQTRGEAAGAHGNRAHTPRAHRYSAPSKTAEDEDPMPPPPMPPPDVAQYASSSAFSSVWGMFSSSSVCVLFVFVIPTVLLLPPFYSPLHHRQSSCIWLAIPRTHRAQSQP
jgi:hypothetical protein